MRGWKSAGSGADADMRVDPNGRYVIELSGGALRLWMVERLRFHTSQPPWQKELVRLLATEIGALPLDDADVFRGVFVSDDRDLVDAENVLFYNLDARSFAHAPPWVRFERSRTPPPPPPSALVGPARYHHIYQGASRADRFHTWDVGPDAHAVWTDVPCSRVTGDRAGWHIWRSLREASPSVALGPAAVVGDSDFAISLTLRVPPGVRASAISAVKGVVDGAIASFQRFPADAPRALAVAELLADVLPEATPEQMLTLLTEPVGQLFAQRPFNAKGRLALSPCDDLCVAGELSVAVDPAATSLRLSGHLAPVRPRPPQR